MSPGKNAASRSEFWLAHRSRLGKTTARAGWAAAVAIILVFLPLSAFAQEEAKPCKCPKDLPRLERALKNARDFEKIFQTIVNNAQANPMSSAEETKQFNQAVNQLRKKIEKKAGPNVRTKVVEAGKIHYDDNGMCVAEVFPAYKRLNCDELVQATLEHEKQHCNYHDQTHWKTERKPQRAMDLGWGGYLAEDELMAYKAEAEFLQGKLEELKKKCPGWSCKCGAHKGQMFSSLAACNKACPIGGMACAWASCYEIGADGKPTGRKN